MICVVRLTKAPFKKHWVTKSSRSRFRSSLYFGRPPLPNQKRGVPYLHLQPGSNNQRKNMRGKRNINNPAAVERERRRSTVRPERMHSNIGTVVPWIIPLSSLHNHETSRSAIGLAFRTLLTTDWKGLQISSNSQQQIASKGQ